MSGMSGPELLVETGDKVMNGAAAGLGPYAEIPVSLWDKCRCGETGVNFRAGLWRGPKSYS